MKGRLSLTGREQPDHLLEYSRALTWQGLLQLCHVDAERENNGPQLIRLWRMSVPTLWAGNHFKYLILCHRLLASKYTVCFLQINLRTFS